jgi:hydrogenase-4 component F
LPAATGALCLFLRSARAVLAAAAAGVLATSGLAGAAAWMVHSTGTLFASRGWLFLDALSAINLVVMALVFTLSSLYACVYFAEEDRAGHLPLRRARQYGALWCASLAAMILVLVSNNLGMMWIGIEATTLVTAFLICVHVTPTSLEAMWKYLLVCSVGVAFAFMGTLLAGASAAPLHLSTGDALLWTRLSANAGALDPVSIKAAFVFLLVGYGTKAGLAPMHSWLPDAHSQAPAPVSAFFSGFMLTAALYCVSRYIPLVEGACGHNGWGRDLLTGLGLISIVVAGAFILFQRDLKRMLAFSSVEHLGIIALGLGLGGIGTFAALFHTLNHSLGKTLAFFSAGRLGQQYGTLEMQSLSGSARSSPVWGIGLFGSLLALIGAAPFALFMSELQIVRAAIDAHSYLALTLFLAGMGIVFVGALRHAIAMAWGETKRPSATGKVGMGEKLLAWGPLGALLGLGLWMPEPLRHALSEAALVIGGQP